MDINGKMEKQISVSLGFIKNVKDSVVKKLNCKDDFELHKKFEGIEFYKKHLKKLVGIYYVEKMFCINLLNVKDLLNSSDEFEFNNTFYKIKVLELDENIVLIAEKDITYIFLHCFNDFKNVKIIGIWKSLNKNEIKLNLDEVKKIIN